MRPTLSACLFGIVLSLVIADDATACFRRFRCRSVYSCPPPCLPVCYPDQQTCNCSGVISSCSITCPNGCFWFKIAGVCTCGCNEDSVTYRIPSATLVTMTVTNCRMGDLDRIFDLQRSHGVTITNPDERRSFSERTGRLADIFR